MGGICIKSANPDNLLKEGQAKLLEAEQHQQQGRMANAKAAFGIAIQNLESIEDPGPEIQELLMSAYLGHGDVQKELKEIEEARISYQKAQKLGSPKADEKIKSLAANFSGQNQIALTAIPAVLPVAPLLPPLLVRSNPTLQNTVIRVSTDPNDIKDTRELAENILKADKTTSNYLYLQRAAFQVLNEFGHQKVKTPELIEEAVELAKANDEKITHELLAQCIDSLVKSQLLNISLIEGLAKILHWSNPVIFKKDDLVRSLKAVTDQLMLIHRQFTSSENEETHYRFLDAVGRLLDAMVDIGVQGINREDQHEPLYDALERYTHDRIGFKAQYCRQGLVRVPNDESRWNLYFRKATAAGKGLAALWSAVSSLDPSALLATYESIQTIAKNQESDQSWYDALRYAELLVEANQWTGFEYFIKN